MKLGQSPVDVPQSAHSIDLILSFLQSISSLLFSLTEVQYLISSSGEQVYYISNSILYISLVQQRLPNNSELASTEHSDFPTHNFVTTSRAS